MIKIFFKKLYYFIILLIIIVFCIFLLEFLLRIYGLGDPVIYKTDLSYGYAPLPNQSVLRLNKSKITINKKGLRATQEWDNQNSNKVLFFGDSVTYGGSYIDDKKIFSELTCSNLNQIEKKKYLCGNAGVNAYGADNIKYRILYGDIQDENWIILTLIEADGFRSLQNILSIPAFLDKPKFLPAIQETLLHIFWKMNIYLRNSHAFQNADSKNNSNSIYVFKYSLKSLRNLLISENQKGKKVLIMLHPEKKDVLNGKPSKNYLLMKKIFEEKESKLILVDMFPIIKTKYSNDLYYDDVHLNKDGHALFAKEISNIIKKYDKYH